VNSPDLIGLSSSRLERKPIDAASSGLTHVRVRAIRDGARLFPWKGPGRIIPLNSDYGSIKQKNASLLGASRPGGGGRESVPVGWAPPTNPISLPGKPFGRWALPSPRADEPRDHHRSDMNQKCIFVIERGGGGVGNGSPRSSPHGERDETEPGDPRRGAQGAYAGPSFSGRERHRHSRGGSGGGMQS
jgi:hypothetical protein